MIWALLHHLLAGMRFLLIDLDIGVDRTQARAGLQRGYRRGVTDACWRGSVVSRQMAGIQAWILQRISAVYLGLFLPAGAVLSAPQPAGDYADWLAPSVIPGSSRLAAVSLAALLHAWIGVRNVVIDYVKPFGVRAGVLLLGVSLIVSGFWTVTILLTPVRIFE